MKTRTLLLMCIITVLLCALAQARIIYVDDDANGTNDGFSWQNAYNFLQDALSEADSLEKPVEIRVAQGIYKPNQGYTTIESPYPDDTSFNLINNVTIKGGYAGVNENNPNARNIELYKSVLSGDLDGDDIEVEDPCDLLKGIRGINSLNVLGSYQNDASAVLDGFTIKGGCFTAFVDP